MRPCPASPTAQDSTQTQTSSCCCLITHFTSLSCYWDWRAPAHTKAKKRIRLTKKKTSYHNLQSRKRHNRPEDRGSLGSCASSPCKSSWMCWRSCRGLGETSAWCRGGGGSAGAVFSTGPGQHQEEQSDLSQPGRRKPSGRAWPGGGGVASRCPQVANNMIVFTSDMNTQEYPGPSTLSWNRSW